jgi:hypothetical protein
MACRRVEQLGARSLACTRRRLHRGDSAGLRTPGAFPRRSSDIERLRLSTKTRGSRPSNSLSASMLTKLQLLLARGLDGFPGPVRLERRACPWGSAKSPLGDAPAGRSELQSHPPG